jgi:hypothetical protein
VSTTPGKATLKKHCGRYMPRQGASEMDKLRALAGVNGARPRHPRVADAAEIGSEMAKIGSDDLKATLDE